MQMVQAPQASSHISLSLSLPYGSPVLCSEPLWCPSAFILLLLQVAPWSESLGFCPHCLWRKSHAAPREQAEVPLLSHICFYSLICFLSPLRPPTCLSPLPSNMEWVTSLCILLTEWFQAQALGEERMILSLGSATHLLCDLGLVT